MPTDGNIRTIFQKHIPEAHWQSVETWSTGRGVPDLNYCLEGCEGWIEAKQTAGRSVIIRPEQVAWVERRIRAGGRVLIVARRRREEGLRTPEADEIYLFPGNRIRLLKDNPLTDCDPLHIGTRGPASWNWDLIRTFLKRNYLA